jgi:hypothetical protein
MQVRRIAGILVAAVLFSVPAHVLAQGVSSITGVVRDTSGAVLPGVTVEAASPALIEKVRSTVTDTEGLYRIVDLRPGEYAVTFTLPGFSTFRRDGIVLPANFTATVNGDMAVGAVEETITVTGEASLVDVQRTQQQLQFERETLSALPGTGRITGLPSVIPGATLTNAVNYSVGGVDDTAQMNFQVHGAPAADPVVDGVNQQIGSLVSGVFVFNQLTFQEVVVETGGIGADRSVGGAAVNIVQRDGGNNFSGGLTYSFTTPDLVASNLTPGLAARGMTESVTLKKHYDLAGAVGGPIMRDRLWFFFSTRRGTTHLYQAGNYYNKLQATQPLFYEPDLSRPSYTSPFTRDYTIRLTSQLAQKHRFTTSTSMQPNCNCPFGLLATTGNVPAAPEATGEHWYKPQIISSNRWTYPATDQFLLEGGVTLQKQAQTNRRRPETPVTVIQVTEQSTGVRYGSRALNVANTGSYMYIPRWQYQGNVAVSRVTASHQFKTGFEYRWFRTGDASRNTDPNQINQGMDYTFNNRQPVSVRIWAVPFAWEDRGSETTFYAQDQWTLDRLTLNLGLRYGDVHQDLSEVDLVAGPFVPARTLPEVKNYPHWRNLNPRVGAAYDLFGTGKTAVKVSLGRFNPVIRATGSAAPQQSQSASTTRSWNDSVFGPGDPRSSNYVPDCDMLSPDSNGECGPWSDRNFGKATALTSRNAPDSIEGFNRQSYNWQGSASIQHELRPGLGLNVGYFRTWYGNFQATDNLAVTPADYTEYCVTAPTDSRLGSVSGQQICGLYDINPAKFGLVDNLITQASHYGERSQVYNGVDVNISARFLQGGQVAGGLSVGRTVNTDCAVIDSPQQSRFCDVTPPWGTGTQVKFLVVYPLPWALQTSVIYQNFAGIETGADIVFSNAAIRPSLGRNLAACGAAATCNQNVTVLLVPPQTMFEPRVQQVDLRFSRLFRLRDVRVSGNIDLANLVNTSNVLNVNRRYGASWLNVFQTIGGRMIKLSAQLDF